jgi:hypothetical protein
MIRDAKDPETTADWEAYTVDGTSLPEAEYERIAGDVIRFIDATATGAREYDRLAARLFDRRCKRRLAELWAADVRRRFEGTE